MNGKIVMLSNSGRVYFMDSFQNTYEILNSKKASYTDVNKIKDTKIGQSFWIIGPTYQYFFDPKNLSQQIAQKRVRKVEFYLSPLGQSPFHDNKENLVQVKN